MITIDNRQIMIEHYKDVVHVASDEVKLKMKEHTICIQGKHLHVLALSKYEILIEGELEGVKFQYEK